MKMSGVLVEKVPKTYFVGVAWTLFTPLRDTISFSNNRIITEINVTCLRNITCTAVESGATRFDFIFTSRVKDLFEIP